jgi:hypothetical protein
VLILLLEKNMHGMKIRSFYIPVRIPRLGVQDELIRQQFGQFCCHCLKILWTNADTRVHGS